MNKFQPFRNEKVIISIRIKTSKLQEIDDISARIDISRNELINQCLEYALRNLEFKDEINTVKV